ncbi:MAG: DinB family protein [Bryobacteraceae bacterium]|jgi:uncharacterized damage-inducible protein DinB
MTEDTAKTIAGFMIDQIEQESATTRKLLAAVPAERSSYKPSDKCMSALDLATHIAAAEVFFLSGVVNGAFEWKQPDFKTPAEVLAFFDEKVPGLIDQVRALPAAKFLAPLELGSWKEPAVTFLTLDLKHGIHHRGQLSTYLRPMGAKVPSMYGPSGDAEPHAAAS